MDTIKIMNFNNDTKDQLKTKLMHVVNELETKEGD